MHKFLRRGAAIVLIAAFSVQDIPWAYPEAFGEAGAVSALQVKTPFKPGSGRAADHAFLVRSCIRCAIGYFGPVDGIERRLTPVLNGVELDLNFRKKYREGARYVVPCSLRCPDRVAPYRYEAVIMPDDSVSLRLPAKRQRKMAQEIPAASAIEELNNPHLSFLAGSAAKVQVKELDYLVVGGGVAGLSCVAGLCQEDKDASIVVISKGAHGKSSTTQDAQGGAAVCLSDEDSPQLHMRDSLVVGDGMCDPWAERILTTETPLRIRELFEWGGEFDTEPDGSVLLGRESGSSVNRIVHAKGAQTGAEIERTLARKVMQLSREARKKVEIDENTFVVDLLMKDGVCVGAVGLNSVTGIYTIYRAKTTALCTGGVSRIYSRNTNPKFSTGDGFALAFRAGAALANMEMIQFHPTALSVIDSEGRSFLISERVRGDGARLKNIQGEYFMERYHPKLEMAPRNIVARAVYREMQETNSGFVYLDTSPIRDFKGTFPKLYEECKARGIDLDTSPLIPVAPAAHFTVGGVLTDVDGQTTVEGLFAMGETAYTGVHGADRMASNSLTEGLVFGRRAAAAMVARAGRLAYPSLRGGDIQEALPFSSISIGEPEQLTGDVEQELDRIMQDRVCLVRDAGGLQDALTRVRALKEEYTKIGRATPKELELRNKLENAEAIIINALERKESRGAHYRSDHAEKTTGDWQLYSRNGLERRPLRVRAEDMAWLFKLPFITKGTANGRRWFFGLDEQIAGSVERYAAAIADQAIDCELPYTVMPGLDDMAGVLALALEKQGYRPVRGPTEDLQPGEFSLTDNKAGSTIGLRIRLLLNTGGQAPVNDISHRFPRWICRELKKRLPALIGKEEAAFMLAHHGVGFVGIINDIPARFRASLKPKQHSASVVINEGALSAVAGIFKALLPRYENSPVAQVENELLDAVIYYQRVNVWVRDSGVDFDGLKAKILEIYGEKRIDDTRCKALLRGIERQYGYGSAPAGKLLRELAIQFITEAVRFHKLPQILDDEGKDVDLDPEVALAIYEFITDNGLVPEGESREAEAAALALLVEGKRIKERVHMARREISSSFDTVHTSPEKGEAEAFGALLEAEGLSQKMTDLMESIVLSGKRLTLAFGRDIRGRDALQVFEVLEKIKKHAPLTPHAKKLLENVTVLKDVDSPETLSALLGQNRIDLDEKDPGGGAKNLLVLFASVAEGGKFSKIEKRANVFSSYIDEGKAAYDLEYYPLPEIVAITLSNVLDHLAGIDRLITDKEEITEILTSEGMLPLSRINIEKIKPGEARTLIFTLIPKATRYDFGRNRDRYALIASYIESAV